MKQAIGILALALAGCATPVQQGPAAKAPLDRHSSYAVEDRPDGFVVSVRHERYQFVPETSAVLTTCKAALMNAAHTEATRRGRKVEINEQQVQASTGRNGLTGITSCEASVPVRWAS